MPRKIPPYSDISKTDVNSINIYSVYYGSGTVLGVVDTKIK